jgi:3'(2'), 5'-bisphosphate nucleotidase
MKCSYKLDDMEINCSALLAVARGAGELILKYFHSDATITVLQKSDNSPVTAADSKAHNYILHNLHALYPTIPCLSEEDKDKNKVTDMLRTTKAFWCVDPLDGTRGFIVGDAAFTVNIALIVDSKPVLGIVYAPALDEMYFGCVGSGAYKQLASGNTTKIIASLIVWEKLRILTGKYYNKRRLESLLLRYPHFQHTAVNSSYKFCLLAAGAADVYPRFGAISLWDVAAGSAILFAAGGRVVDFAAQDMLYTVQDDFGFLPFIALGRSAGEMELLGFIRKIGESSE